MVLNKKLSLAAFVRTFLTLKYVIYVRHRLMTPVDAISYILLYILLSYHPTIISGSQRHIEMRTWR